MAMLRSARAAKGRRDRAADDVLARFARGEISRKKAMAELDVDYGELIEMMADRNLALPRVTEAEADRMADTVLRLLDEVDAGRHAPHP
jgi:hypothetical protein